MRRANIFSLFLMLGKIIQSFTIVILSVDFLQMFFIKLRELSIPRLLRGFFVCLFNHEWILNIIKCFFCIHLHDYIFLLQLVIVIISLLIFFLEGDQILSGCSYLLWEFRIFYFPINSVNFCLIYYAHLLGICTLMVLCLQDGNTFFFMKCPSLSLVIIFIFILFGINIATPAFLYYV